MATGRSDGLNQDYSRGLHLWFASRLDARHTVRRWFGEQRVNMKTPITPQGLPPYIYGWEVGPNEKVWSEAAVREALAAQALTAPNLACKSAQARLATQWGYVRAASVEPVGKIINSGGNTGSLPEHPLLVWLGGVPPVGTELYAGAPPAHIPADVEASGWCEYVAGMVGHWVRSDEYAGIKADEDRCTKAIAGIIERRLWALKHSPQPQAVVASSPAQAVDAVGESCAIFDSRGYYDWYDTEAQAKAWCDRYNARNVDDPLRPYTYVRLDALRAALQASRQPQAQQAVAEGAGDGLRQTLIDVGRVIAWQCFGDCRAYDEFGPGSLRGLHEMDAEIRAALATKEPK